MVNNGLDDRTFEHDLAKWRELHPVESVESLDSTET